MFYFSPDRATHHGHIKEKRPNSNPQADSIRAKVLDQVTLFLHIFLDFLTPKLVYIWTKRMKFAFDNGHKMTPKRHVIAFIVSFKIFLMHFLYFFFGESAYLPKSLSLEVMILKVKTTLPCSNIYSLRENLHHQHFDDYEIFVHAKLTCFFLFLFFKMSSGISSMTA